jgi:hypothetical protein
MRAALIAGLFIATAATSAEPQGCDVDTNMGHLCCRYAFRAVELEALLEGVGSLRELSQRVQKAGMARVWFTGTYPGRVLFDENGRPAAFFRDGLAIAFTWDAEGRFLASKESKYSEELSASASPTSCRVKVDDGLRSSHWEIKLTLEGSKLTETSASQTEEYEVVADGLKQKASYVLRRDAQGRLVRDRHDRELTFGAKSTQKVSRWADDDGRKRVSKSTWSLDANGLPTTWSDDGRGATLTWRRRAKVRVIDGTCPAKQRCDSPEIAVVSAGLTAEAEWQYTVERGDPPNTPRTVSEVWFQKGWEDLAQAVRGTDALKDRVTAENVKEWTWGGPFDVLVILGPKPKP